jgi:hypothetical protein
MTDEEYDDLFNKKVKELDPNEITETLSIEQGLMNIRQKLIINNI